MPDQRDTVLIEQSKIQRMRLGSALLYGRLDERRTVNDYLRRLMASLIIAAVACAVCVGVSFVVQLLSDQAKAAPAAIVTPASAALISEVP
jgi:cation transporter-like permease